MSELLSCHAGFDPTKKLGNCSLAELIVDIVSSLLLFCSEFVTLMGLI
ncbi:hypothetical protein H1P_30016 [Hyella patelloides LEGE 07179]|uniref:Uncharacterized protein n=1 Tax=Hyella patelloides LEGE 07179 TaxID=945734 RepID=A0A563VU18_9CYAN|nr:hypothetical protein H1P_30016 [Hyella patelloides LEGE 07179]